MSEPPEIGLIVVVSARRRDTSITGMVELFRVLAVAFNEALKRGAHSTWSSQEPPTALHIGTTCDT